ncbi:hypothetical protein [Sphaerimonospora thailandensis]|uniref:Uncharacterized protein n=1 Tax=Sphaerimonospora thailandensis TaxID=795644 RepID=A0A8J3W1L2_9ACTN|nr:hypothetical protein [Sphaerimonospora thailandensis]GIH72887.1 hypothetical protein Mth01_51400 [Sphaerimonospora thailandensis]
MPGDKLSLPQTITLAALMLEAKEISNTELEKRYGFTLTGKDRIKLNNLKLVESRKQGRTYVHELTDDGWVRMAEEFRAGIAVSAGRTAKVLGALVAIFQRFTDRIGYKPADVFAREDMSSALSDISSSRKVSHTPSAPLNVEARIRDAYQQLAEQPNTWVSLTQLRPLLGDIAREDVDTTLRRMIGMADVRIVPESNQKILTKEDRQAAVTIGDQAKHLILIGA